MEPNKILSASILDLVFDGRNKDYGAYELRFTYPQRVKRSLIVVFVVAAIAVAGAAFANSFKSKEVGRIVTTVYSIPDLPPQEKKIPPPEPPKPKPPEIKTIKVVTPRIVPENDETETPPTEDDKKNALTADVTNDGKPFDGIVGLPEEIDKTGIIEPKKDADQGPVWFVEVEAKFTGNWTRFLTTHLNAEVPVKNGAPPASYTVIIQFVIDQQGNMSDIKALTSHGYGMEEEALRVMGIVAKWAAKWTPAIQNGHAVKAYRKQPITFVVTEE